MTDLVKTKAYPLALSCWNCNSGYCYKISSTIGIIIPQYNPSFMVSQSFSQNKPLCLPYFPLIKPQNIHPIFLWCRGYTQSGYSFSLSLQVIQIRVYLPDCAHISSLQRISSHCSSVQLICSCAHSSLFFLFSSDRGHFLLETRRLYPSFLNTVLIAASPQSQPSIPGIATHGVSRLSLEAVTHWISFFL